METPLKLSNYANMLITSILSIIIGKTLLFFKASMPKTLEPTDQKAYNHKAYT